MHRKLKAIILKTLLLPLDTIADGTYLYAITVCYVRREMRIAAYLYEEHNAKRNDNNADAAGGFRDCYLRRLEQMHEEIP